MGPTGSGKTPLAERLADMLSADLVNADAFQVYRGMDIGTSKPTAKERYQLLDIKDPEEQFGVGEWVRLALALLQESFEGGRNVIVVGGTGFYVRALFEEYDDLAELPSDETRAALNGRELDDLLKELQERAPDVAAQIDTKNPVRVKRALERLDSVGERLTIRLPAFRKLKVALNPAQEVLDQILAKRFHHMIESGWNREVRLLLEKGVPVTAPGMRAIGYQCLADFIAGHISEAEACDSVLKATRAYAKRQRTWLRSEPGLVQFTDYRWDESGIRETAEKSFRLINELEGTDGEGN